MSTKHGLAPVDLLNKAKTHLADDDFLAINSIDMEICAHMQKIQHEQSFNELSEEQKICVATFNAESHVSCGGLFDFFEYSSDDEIKATIEGFETFGSKDLLFVIQEAIKLFPQSPPLPPRTVREEILDAWFENEEDPLEKIESKFHEIGSARKERLEYIVNHADQFFTF